MVIDDRGVVFWRYKDSAVVGITEAKEEVDVVSEQVACLLGGACLLYIDIRGIRKIDREARRLFASDEISQGSGGWPL